MAKAVLQPIFVAQECCSIVVFLLSLEVLRFSTRVLQCVGLWVLQCCTSATCPGCCVTMLSFVLLCCSCTTRYVLQLCVKVLRLCVLVLQYCVLQLHLWSGSDSSYSPTHPPTTNTSVWPSDDLEIRRKSSLGDQNQFWSRQLDWIGSLSRTSSLFLVQGGL